MERDWPVLAESMRLLRELLPDVVFASAYTGDDAFEEVTNGSWPEKVGDALRRLVAPS